MTWATVSAVLDVKEYDFIEKNNSFSGVIKGLFYSKSKPGIHVFIDSDGSLKRAFFYFSNKKPRSIYYDFIKYNLEIDDVVLIERDDVGELIIKREDSQYTAS